VALFIVVPLTLTLKKWCAIPVNRLIIFEALAVNAGSLLTPIGNPQNILLWGRSGLSFFGFIGQMLPLAAAMMLTLLALCWFCFPAKRLSYQSSDRAPSWQPKLVWSCLGLYVVFLTALEMNQALWGLALVLLGFLVLARAVIVHVDWSLLLVFMVMFIDVHLLTQLPALHQVLSGVGTLSGGGLWLTAIGLSQVISNVPSTILLLNYVPPSILLAWAVNVGGFGLLPGSLANIIALRMASDRRIWWRFHLYSIPMLLWAALSGYWLFKLSA
ncbi:TPA: anion transporter, partial [Klebsiella pneumoniae]|nr:anion transporter [Klebsiella pneumoniae]